MVLCLEARKGHGKQLRFGTVRDQEKSLAKAQSRRDRVGKLGLGAMKRGQEKLCVAGDPSILEMPVPWMATEMSSSDGA